MSRLRRIKTRTITSKDIKPLGDEELESLYLWVDEIPLTRPKKNLARDFADGVMISQVVSHFIPHIVERHNYQPASGTKGKKENWMLFDRKVLSQLNLELSEDVINKVINAQQFAIEQILVILRGKIEEYLTDQACQGNNLRPEADQFGSGKMSGYEPSGFNKSQSMQNLSRRRRVQTEEVPVEHLIEKENLIAQQTDTIEMLTEKIQKLEHLCTLKDKRIEDMSERLLQLQTASSRQPQPKRQPHGRMAPMPGRQQQHQRQPAAPQGYYQR